MTQSTTQFLRSLVLMQMENLAYCGLSRAAPADFDALQEAIAEATSALHLLERVDTLDLHWNEMRAVKNLVLYHEGNEVPPGLVHPDTLEAVFEKMNKV